MGQGSFLPILFLVTATPALCIDRSDPDSLKTTIAFSAFVDVYYAYDLGHPADDERPHSSISTTGTTRWTSTWDLYALTFHGTGSGAHWA